MEDIKYIFENGFTIILPGKEAKRLYNYLHVLYSGEDLMDDYFDGYGGQWPLDEEDTLEQF